MAVEAKAAIVPESVLKKRKRAETWALAKTKDLEQQKKKNAENRKIIFSRALQYAKEYESKVTPFKSSCSFQIIRWV